VLYEDNHCLAVSKPAGLLTVADKTNDLSLLDVARQYIKDKYGKPGNAFLGVVHRLDRPVSGIVLFARTSKAAARLSQQFRTGDVRKIYWACVEGVPREPCGELVDYLVKDSRLNKVSATAESRAQSKRATLRYETVWSRSAPAPISSPGHGERRNDRTKLSAPPKDRGKARGNSSVSMLEIEPQTGRSHQIRVQLAERGTPIIGDVKYGAARPWLGRIALHAAELEFEHPVRHVRIRIKAAPPREWETLRR
jgi:23S rRNA pseudouridine1911/1915/1917 synthase